MIWISHLLLQNWITFDISPRRLHYQCSVWTETSIRVDTTADSNDNQDNTGFCVSFPICQYFDWNTKFEAPNYSEIVLQPSTGLPLKKVFKNRPWSRSISDHVVSFLPFLPHFIALGSVRGTLGTPKKSIKLLIFEVRKWYNCWLFVCMGLGMTLDQCRDSREQRCVWKIIEIAKQLPQLTLCMHGVHRSSGSYISSTCRVKQTHTHS